MTLNTYIISIVFLFAECISVSDSWSSSAFSMNSKLPKSCGYMKNYLPENDYISWGSWPWLGLLSHNGLSRCNCILIHEQVALAGTLCVKNAAGSSRDGMNVSFSNRGLPSFQTVAITHIQFSSQNEADDKTFALMRLERKLLISANVQPICLWEENKDYATQLDSNIGMMIGSDLATNAQQSIFSVYQSPIQIVPRQRCRTQNKDLMCILHYKQSSNCHYIGSPLMFPRLSEDGSIVWYLRGMQTQRLSSCNTGNTNTLFDLASKRKWIESHFRASITSGCGRRKVAHTPLIISGEEATRGDFPWHVGIFYRRDSNSIGDYKCGGSIISESFVLTAAHCTTIRGQARPPETMTLLLGKHDFSIREAGATMKGISQIIVHEGFSESTLRNDLSLLRFDSDVVFTEYIQPVCLWEEADISKENIYGQEGRVPGWGFDNDFKLTTLLYVAKMPIQRDETCLLSKSDFYSKFLTNTTLCAGNPRQRGSSVCNGDSGGGLVLPYVQDDKQPSWFLRGIVSVTVSRVDKKVCDFDYFPIFTDIAKYMKWITDNTQRL